MLDSICALTHASSLGFHLDSLRPDRTRITTDLQSFSQQVLGNLLVVAEYLQSDRCQPDLRVLWHLGTCFLQYSPRSSESFLSLLESCRFKPHKLHFLHLIYLERPLISLSCLFDLTQLLLQLCLNQPNLEKCSIFRILH